MRLQRRAIALMITLFFIMAISVSLALALKQVKTTTQEVSKQEFAMQSSVIVDDVLNLLKDSTELDAIDSAEALFTFLSEASIIPFESNGVNIVIELRSARAKLNINSLTDANATRNTPRVNAFRDFMTLYNVNNTYTEMIIDGMSKIKPDNSYKSDIFNENPYLFRDYISSINHLVVINDFYKKTYNEDSLNEIPFEKLFYFSKDRGTKIDLNYADTKTWQLLLGCDEGRAEQLLSGSGSYTKIQELNLDERETVALKALDLDRYFEQYLDVKVSISKGSLSSELKFEYDMNTKKGSNFVYEI